MSNVTTPGPNGAIDTTEMVDGTELDTLLAERVDDDLPRVLTVDEIRERSAGLPWWRRPRRLKRQLAWTLVGTALASVLLIGVVNFVAARDLLDEGTQDQLVGIGKSRARTIDEGIDRTLAQVSAVSGDLGLVQALEELSGAFTGLDGEELTADQLAELEGFYDDNVVPLFNEVTGESRTVDAFLPDGDAARYLQYHYTVAPRLAGDDARSVDDAGDGSEYSELHARHHPALRAAAATLDVGDVILVSNDGDIVYTTDKRVDLGTSLISGPYAGSQLATLFTDALPGVRTGSALLTNVQLYAPADGRPIFFAGATVKNETAVIGTVAVEIPADALSAITTSLGRWEDVGLASGESYVVDDQRLLTSESRTWLEDPAKFLREVDDEAEANAIEILGTPVGIQAVDTTPVQEAFRSGTYSGTTRNYLGTRTFSYAETITAAGVNWVVVVDIPLSDAREPLYDYALSLGLVLAIILPVAALIGLFLARRLTRRIPPVVDGAQAIIDGDRDPEIDVVGRDEFGDLARRLRNMARELGAREQELADEYESRRELLLAVLPPRAVDERDEGGTAELADVATTIAVLIDVELDELIGDDDRQADLLDQVAEVADAAMVDRSIERVRASADGYLFLAGAGTDGDGVADALAFTRSLAEGMDELRARENHDVGMHVGIATGPVATGVLNSGSLTFGAWGHPVRQAMAIAAMSGADEVLVDESTASSSGAAGAVHPSTDIVDLDGRPMNLSTLN